MEMGGLILWSIILGAVAISLICAIRQAAPRVAGLPVTAEWIEELSLDRYRPMLRLLDADDFRTLRSRPGVTPALAARLRRQHCQIFFGYLQSLRDDFGRVSLALKLLMAQAAQDRPDLAGILLRSQLQFGYGMVLVRIRLLLFSYGIGTVNAGSLLKIFDGLRLELRTLVPASAALGA